MNERPIRRRPLLDTTVYPIGLGCASLTFQLAADRRRAEDTIQSALDSGVTLFDTAAAYATPDGRRHNEELLGQVLRRNAAADVLVSTKGGHRRVGEEFPVDASPRQLRIDLDESLRSLGRDHIDLYFLHWPDPNIPIGESVSALEQLRRAGKIRGIGLSNVTVDQIHQAETVAPIAAIQNPLSMGTNDEAVVFASESQGIAYLAYSPLSTLRSLDADRLLRVTRLAAQLSLTPAQLMLAGLLQWSPHIIPLAGATRSTTAREAAESASTELSMTEFAELVDSVAT